MPRTRPTPRSLALFTVVLANEATAEAVVLHAARTADQATIAFHQALQRLIQDRVVGELVVIHHDEHPRTLLRMPLGPGAGTPRSGPPQEAQIVTVPTPVCEADPITEPIVVWRI